MVGEYAHPPYKGTAGLPVAEDLWREENPCPRLRLVHGVVNGSRATERSAKGEKCHHAVYEPRARARTLLALRFHGGSVRSTNSPCLRPDLPNRYSFTAGE